MKKVFIIHGFGGIPNGGWFPWLMKELAKEDIAATSLLMPNTKDPVVSEWVNTMHNFIGEPSSEIFIIGHSLGVPAVLRYLESLPSDNSLGGVVLVSGFIESLEKDNSQSDFRKIDAFVNPLIDFVKIKSIPKYVVVVHGAKDKVVPFDHAEKISSSFGCKLVRVENGDHFSQKMEPICYELPEALEALKEMIK